jgi:hypothetical protein
MTMHQRVVCRCDREAAASDWNRGPEKKTRDGGLANQFRAGIADAAVSKPAPVPFGDGETGDGATRQRDWFVWNGEPYRAYVHSLSTKVYLVIGRRVRTLDSRQGGQT